MKARNWSPATTALGLNRRDSAVATVVLPAPGGPVTTMRSGTPTMMPEQPPRTPHVLTDPLTRPRQTGGDAAPPEDGPEPAAPISGTYRPSTDQQDGRRFAHNPATYGRRSVTPTTDANGIGSHDPLSDACVLFPQVRSYIGHLCGIF